MVLIENKVPITTMNVACGISNLNKLFKISQVHQVSLKFLCEISKGFWGFLAPRVAKALRSVNLFASENSEK